MAVVCSIKMNHCVPVYKLTLCSFVLKKNKKEEKEKKIQEDTLKYAR